MGSEQVRVGTLNMPAILMAVGLALSLGYPLAAMPWL
jgi:hypothetical protein